MVKVYNPHLYGLYLLCKEELECDGTARVEERMLFHATSPVRAEMIASENINWRLTCRTRFGRGACFSSSAKYAHSYSSMDGGIKIMRNSLCFDMLNCNFLLFCFIFFQSIRSMQSSCQENGNHRCQLLFGRTFQR